MTHLNNLLYSPHGKDPGGTSIGNEEKDDISAEASENQPEVKEDKSIIKKIKEALQEWSNKDEADLEYDNTGV